jgi:hypothetical protein
MVRKLFDIIRNLLAIIGLCSLLAGGAGLFLVARSYYLPPRLLVLKALDKFGMGNSAVAEMVKPPPMRPEGLVLPDLDAAEWQGHGARRDRQVKPLVYDLQGRPLPSEGSYAASAVQNPLPGRIVAVRDVNGFLNAIKQAAAGDVITLTPGTYRITAYNIEVTSPGSPLQPVIVRAQRLGDVRLELDSLEGFWVNAPYWVFENLEIKGVSGNHDSGEHAFHIVGDGRSFVLRNCRVQDFNSLIKANGLTRRDGSIHFPDHALIENNHLFNSEIRRTSNPVNAIDLVGPDHWVVRGNLIADFCKGEGDRISYAAFLKGNSSHGVFENNLVIGEYRTTGGVRVGLSLGGGGSGAQFSRNGSNETEHTGGIVRNNIVMYFGDVGLYLNKARDTKVFNNTFYRTAGIDVRFSASSAVVRNNLLTGRIKERDGGTSLNDSNLVVDMDEFAKWFVRPEQGDFTLKVAKKLIDQGVASDLVTEDFCGNPRIGKPDVGAIEYAQGSLACMPLLGIGR